jgi:glutamyl-tRNA synthetase
MSRVRFAPSLSGPLYLAAARVALVNNLVAHRDGGHLTLRLDDLTNQGHPETVMQDLAWIGVTWGSVMRQSERRDRYAQVFAGLERDGFVYPCFETEEELRAKDEFRRRRKQPAIYDRAMLKLTDKQRRDAEANGKRPHWRFKLSDREIAWRDLILGHRSAALPTVSDPILMQADGAPTQIFAALVDDIDNGTTHIIRGEDRAGNTAIQMELLEVLTGRANAMRFGHLPVLADPTEGRRGNVSLRTLRQDGIDPNALVDALIGPTETIRLPDLKDRRFSMRRLLDTNRQLLRQASYAQVADRLPAGATEAFWLAVRDHLDLLREARGWWDVVAGSIVPPVVEGEQTLLRIAAALLPPEPWSPDVGSHWIAALHQKSGRTVDDIDVPLRLALTGEDTGPDLAALLPLIGRARATTRLEIAAA